MAKIIEHFNDVVNQLNDFFLAVGPLTESSIPRSENISPTKFFKQRNQLDFFLARVPQVIGIINPLTASNPVKLLRLIPDLIIVPLCKIINLSFVSSSFPGPLEIVKVIPIHKNGSTEDTNNYHLSIFDKIMEKIIQFFEGK